MQLGGKDVTIMIPKLGTIFVNVFLAARDHLIRDLDKQRRHTLRRVIVARDTEYTVIKRKNENSL